VAEPFLEVLLFALALWAMRWEMIRNPEASFFRPVIMGLAPFVLFCAYGFFKLEKMDMGEFETLREAVFARMKAMSLRLSQPIRRN
jgi:hypothetical protein